MMRSLQRADVIVMACAFALLGVACTGHGFAAVRGTEATDQTRTELLTEIAYPQLYPTPDGETHFREVKVLLSVASLPPTQPFAQSAVQPATTIRHAVFPPRWGVYDRDHNIFHTPADRRFISIRRGETWVKTSDGETRHFQVGDVFEVLDVGPSKGHITWMGDQPSIMLFSNHP